MISYQKLFDKLKEEGWSFYRVRQEKLIGQGTLTSPAVLTARLWIKSVGRLIASPEILWNIFQTKIPNQIQNNMCFSPCGVSNFGI